MYLLKLSLLLLFSVAMIPLLQAQCAAGETEIQFNLVPDNYGSEISWSFTGLGNGTTYASGGPYTNNNTTPINETICVPTGTQVVFSIQDSYGDGICCAEGNGSYTITVDGIVVKTGGSYGSGETTAFFAPLLAYDIGMNNLTSPFPMVGLGETVDIKSSLNNTSSSIITSLSLSYQIGTSTPVTESFTGLNIPVAGSYAFTFSTPWTAQAVGQDVVRVWVNDMNNGQADMYHANDTAGIPIEVYNSAPTPNKISDFLTTTPTISMVANASNQVNKPTDLDFHPDLDRDELWVINEDIESSGGSTVTISNPGLPNQSHLWLRDGNAWHFMSLPTALAFGTNGNWASSPGVFDANHDGGAPFTGPTLWSSNMAVYAQNAGPGTNGSHLDMLHETPHGMGIAHHKDNAYWLFDGNANNIVYYDFVEDHGPGMSYHGDGIIRRYSEVSVSKDGDVPSHLILDKSTGWLYIIDTGNDRVLRMNTATGTVKNPLSEIEDVAEYSEMENVVSETVISSGLTRPCGIELIDDRLLVGDYANGDINIYDISSMPATFLGKLTTGAPGLTGIKIGPNGDIWYTNRLTNEVSKMTPSISTNIAQTASEEVAVNILPNPANNQVSVQFSVPYTGNIQVVDALGRTVLEMKATNQTAININTSDWTNGMYWLKTDLATQKLHVQH